MDNNCFRALFWPYLCNFLTINPYSIFKPEVQRLACTWFHRIAFIQELACVYLLPRILITSGMIWSLYDWFKKLNHSRWKSFAVVEMNCNSLENVHGCMVILCGQTLLHSGIIAIYRKSFAVTNQSAKTVKLFHLKRFAIYSIQLLSGICNWYH